jgi:hypothetical protein
LRKENERAPVPRDAQLLAEACEQTRLARESVELRRRFPIQAGAGCRLLIYSSRPVSAVVGFAALSTVCRRRNYPQILCSNSTRLPSPSVPGDCFWPSATTFSEGDIRSHAQSWAGTNAGQYDPRGLHLPCKNKRLRPGDVLFFDMSKDERYEASQSTALLNRRRQRRGLDPADGETIRLLRRRAWSHECV